MTSGGLDEDQKMHYNTMDNNNAVNLDSGGIIMGGSETNPEAIENYNDQEINMSNSARSNNHTGGDIKRDQDFTTAYDGEPMMNSGYEH